MSAADRLDLLTQIRSAQADLDQALSQLGSEAGTVLADGASQRQLLVQLERSLSNGTTMPIGLLRSEIAGAIAATANLGQQVRLANEQRAILDLATAQARTRASVMDMNRDIYERRIFDPYLQFATAEDEAAYRRREEQNRRAIEDALAENTPQGDLRAARIMHRQLRDVGAHGADASPQFRELANRNAQDIERLESALDREPAPEAGRAAAPSEGTEQPAPATNEQLASVLATFRAAGIAGGIPAQDTGHGLSTDSSAPDHERGVRT